ncbi:hypothetical protein DICPUDRAFT_155073 [Dictyostelium purpureum]|uniref:Uncharacterized protein n=1 Tax=Dictyostelium purpureum TaxID=5786 RepID=F0ZT05_DICPU|nr:uncharacterized protein DICPUDRAFT_155073 [Dictyostelium purpureum]EGC32942.1 hypothetical protein DICPUDRAFT_155073 [Dictyostelium purpureum]|eukprot:XP_003290550.1 hypothetical protein DICPUDRAFT_155073 [Dictyostelium purpureum]
MILKIYKKAKNHQKVKDKLSEVGPQLREFFKKNLEKGTIEENTIPGIIRKMDDRIERHCRK